MIFKIVWMVLLFNFLLVVLIHRLAYQKKESDL